MEGCDPRCGPIGRRQKAGFILPCVLLSMVSGGCEVSFGGSFVMSYSPSCSQAGRYDLR